MATKASSAVQAQPAFAESRIARYLSRQIDIAATELNKSQRQIAAEIGYNKPNMISMFKRGDAKVPLDKVPLLARALHVDAGHLFRLALEQYWIEDAQLIAEMFGTVCSKHEVEILEYIRKVSDNTDPKLRNEHKTHLRDAFGV